jgi:hypothetical protein
LGKERENKSLMTRKEEKEEETMVSMKVKEM